MVGVRCQSIKPRLLAIEDDELVARNWGRLLGQRVEFVNASSFEEAWRVTESEAWRSAPFDYVFVDLRLPDGSGVDLLDRLNAEDPRPGIAVISGFIDAYHAMAIHGRCAIAVPKPAGLEVLLGVLAILKESRTGGLLVERYALEYGLSPQETRLLVAAVREATNEEAAEELGCTHATVRSYWRRIFEKTSHRSAREVITHLFRFALGSDASTQTRDTAVWEPASVRRPIGSPGAIARPLGRAVR